MLIYWTVKWLSRVNPQITLPLSPFAVKSLNKVDWSQQLFAYMQYMQILVRPMYDSGSSVYGNCVIIAVGFKFTFQDLIFQLIKHTGLTWLGRFMPHFT